MRSLRGVVRAALELRMAQDGPTQRRACRFCGQPIVGREFPITLAGGSRIIGYICWPCLSRAAEEVRASCG